MTIVRSTLFVVVATLVLSFGSVARADNTTCANAEHIFPGEIAADATSASSSAYYKTAVVGGRSYSLTSWSPWQDAAQGAFIFTNGFFTDNDCTTAATTQGNSNSEPSPVPDNIHIGDHDSIIPESTGTLYIRVFNLGPSVTMHVRFVETTLFSPWWFVGGTNQAFAEIRNNTYASVDYTATFFRSDGTTCGSSSGTLAANGNTAVSVGTVGTCAAAQSGSAQVAFQGQMGAVSANLTTIDGVQATSFDSPFTPRGSGLWGRGADPAGLILTQVP